MHSSVVRPESIAKLSENCGEFAMFRERAETDYVNFATLRAAKGIPMRTREGWNTFRGRFRDAIYRPNVG